MKKNPFSTLKQEPKAVVQRPDGSSVYFISTGFISADINPISSQEKQKKQAEMTVLFFEAAEEMARRKNISPEQARDMFSPKKKEGEAVVIVADPIEYLTSEQKILYFKLASESEEIPITVSTMLMRSRLAFDIILSEPAKAKARQLYINEPWFDVHTGDWFKFGSIRVQITEPYDPESGAIGVAAIASPLEISSVGFLLNSDLKTYRMGDSDWTEKDTREKLSLETKDGSKPQITAIYEFYLEEAGRLATEPSTEGKSLTKNPPLLNSSEEISSIGENSTGESNPMESQMNGSTPPTLEVALIG